MTFVHSSWVRNSEVDLKDTCASCAMALWLMTVSKEKKPKTLK